MSGPILPRVVAGVSLITVGTIIGSLGTVVLVPLFLSVWGAGRFGEWLTLLAVVQYVWLCDLGLPLSLVAPLASHFARGEVASYNRLLRSGLRGTLVLGFGGAIAFSAATRAVPFESWFAFEHLSRGDSQTIATIIGVEAFLAIPGALVRYVYRTCGETGRFAAVMACEKVAVIATALVGLIFRAEPVVLAILVSLPRPILTAFVLLDVHRRHREIHLGVAGGSWSDGTHLLGRSIPLAAYPVVQTTLVHGSTVAIGALAGPLAVTAFSTARTLANLLKQITEPVATSIWPEVGTLEASGQMERLRGIFFLSMRIVATLTLAAGVVLLALGGDLYVVWTRRQLEFDPLVLSLLVAPTVIGVPWLTAATFCMAGERQRALSIAFGLQFVVTALLVAGGLAASPATGAYTVQRVLAGALGLGELLSLGVLAPWFAARFLGFDPRWYVTRVFAPWCAVALTALIVALGVGRLGGPFLIRAGAVTVLLVAIVFALWRGWFSREERSAVSQRILALRERRTGAG